MRSFLATALFALTLQAQAPAYQPVPEAQVSGTTFTAEDRSFTVDAPAGWKWYRMPAVDNAAKNLHPEIASATYFAVDPATRDAYILSVISDGSGTAPNEDYMRGMQSGLERTSPKTGWSISGFVFEKAAIPFAGAYHYSCVATSTAGVVKHRFGYVAGVETKYHFSYSTTAAEESEQFRRFVASFRR